MEFAGCRLARRCGCGNFKSSLASDHRPLFPMARAEEFILHMGKSGYRKSEIQIRREIIHWPQNQTSNRKKFSVEKVGTTDTPRH
jgi:hypothetical protein